MKVFRSDITSEMSVKSVMRINEAMDKFQIEKVTSFVRICLLKSAGISQYLLELAGIYCILCRILPDISRRNQMKISEELGIALSGKTLDAPSLMTRYLCILFKWN